MPGSKKTNSYDRAVAARIRALRLARGMSQAELGARIGVTFQQVQKYETGVNRIGAGRLQRIAAIFDVPLAALFESPEVRRKGGADPLAGLGMAGAARLVQAYSRIRDAMVRRAFVRLAEEVASRES
jgi:transcriptional regulator with XRE-family HTH domain